MTRVVEIGGIRIGGGKPFVLIAGPCVIEGADPTLEVAERLLEITKALDIPLIFKASFDKANRSSMDSYRGPGLEEGLKVLEMVRQRCGIPVLTDIHCVSQVEAVARVVDLLQIPAFLSRQTDLILEAARTMKPVNIKKGQFMAPWDVRNAVEKVLSTGNRRVMVTERGVSFGYNNLVVDFRAFPIIRSFGCPVIFDVTHSLQQPGGLGRSSGGQREYVPYLARAAVACGVDGIFMEVHTDPERALCDGPNSFPLEGLSPLLRVLKDIDLMVKTSLPAEV